MTVSPDAAARLAQAAAFRLTTAEILYRLPDHPGLLQTYVWQAMDIPPRFPALRKFLSFWEAQIEGPLHSVRIGAVDAAGRGRRFAHADVMAALH